jgi:hypothetical protein
MKRFNTREEWLQAAVTELRPICASMATDIALNIRVSCGFPSTFKRSGAIGECWADTASADKTMEILVSPTLADPAQVFEVLVHELCHTMAGCMNHGTTFAKNAGAMLLLPSASKGWKATQAGPDFATVFGPLIESLGDYPHAQLSVSGKKTQATRMLKCYCPECGYTVRLTHKWAAVGMPICPTDHMHMILETSEQE